MGETIITYNSKVFSCCPPMLTSVALRFLEYFFLLSSIRFDIFKTSAFLNAANILTVCRVVYEQHTINHFKLSIFQFRVFQLNNNAWNVAISQQHSLLGIIVIAVRNCSQQRVVLCCAQWPTPKGIGIGDNFFPFNSSF